MRAHMRFMFMRKSVFLLLFALLISINPAWSQQKRNLTVDDFFALQDISDPQLSPDGKMVACVVERMDLKEDKSYSDIYLIPFAGGEVIQLTSDQNENTHPLSTPKPRWTPDGKSLSFLGKREEGETQIFLVKRNGGVTTQLTDLKQEISDYEWSPDGKNLAILMTDKDPNKSDEEEDGKEKNGKEKDDTPKPIVVTRIQTKMEDIGFLDDLRDHIYVYNVDTKELKQITSGPYDDSSPRWSPDGSKILFVSNRTDKADTNRNDDLFLVPAAGGEPKKLTNNAGPDESPEWSPDGKWIAYLRSLHPELIYYDVTELAMIPSSGGEPIQLTNKLDRNILIPQFSDDSKSIYFLLEDQTAMRLSNMSIKGGTVNSTIAPEKVLSSYDVNANGIVYVSARSDKPPEVYAVAKRKSQQISQFHTRAFENVELGKTEAIQFKSSGDAVINGFVVKPPNFDASKKYPLISWIHGGPNEQYQPDFDSYMIFRAQLLAANGYVVSLINYRGGSGYGLEFSKSIFADWGNKEVDDIMAGVDYVISLGYVDPNLLGVGGWSYGGILTDAIITKTDRFKAAISGAGIANAFAGYGTDQYQYEYEMELGFPWEKPDAWFKVSPFFNLGKVKTPTLFICAEKDWNVPLINSEQMYQGLRRLGIDTMLIVYPDELSHTVSTPSYVKDLFQRYLAWFGHYLKGEPSKVPPKEK